MKSCVYCGTRNPDSAAACASCGTAEFNWVHADDGAVIRTKGPTERIGWWMTVLGSAGAAFFIAYGCSRVPDPSLGEGDYHADSSRMVAFCGFLGGIAGMCVGLYLKSSAAETSDEPAP